MISVIIPSYNTPREYLLNLYNSIITQSFKIFEVIIVDDHSDFDYYSEIIHDERFQIVRKKTNSGPAEARNIGVQNATFDLIFFTDADCELQNNLLEKIAKYPKKNYASMGDTITKTATVFGTAVAFMGFPGGGSIGFENVWHVDKYNNTNSISSCNLVITKDVFHKVNMFDTTFPVPGGEDTVLAKTIISFNQQIKFNKEQVVFHVERGDFKGFIRWQITRGRGNFHIKKKLGNVRSFYKLRLWSFKNSLLQSKLYAPLVFLLILLSVIYQKRGYRIEKRNHPK